MRVDIGLEKRIKIDLIEVHWPSGAVDRVTNMDANTIITIKEGQGVVALKDFKSAAQPARRP
jgi:hypothetical protein